jgi:hypothetical protein
MAETVSPAYQQALEYADIIGDQGYANMGVTMSWGCEYCNSEDVLVPFPPRGSPQSPSHQSPDDLAKQVQSRLNELGATPKLAVDGKIGPMTLRAMLTALSQAYQG